MKIRTRLAILFTLIVASLLGVFALSVYYFSASYRKKEFYERLDEKARNYARLNIQLGENSAALMKLFDRNTDYLTHERILLFDSNNTLVFNTNDDSVTVSPVLLNTIRQQKELRYTEAENEVLALLYSNNNKLFVVIVSAFDKDGLSKLHNLKIILIAGLFVCVIVTMLAGWIYSGQALSPITNVVEQVERTNATNLTSRVSEGNGKDEIGQLAITFNRMLERIQKAFEMQKSFVSNSSHELRTPLTAITGQIEVALLNEREPQEYKAILSSILDDIRSVNNLTNGLLELAKADMDLSRIKMKKIRIDELLWQTRNDFLKRHNNRKVEIKMTNFPDEERQLLVLGSEHLLRSAITNILDNACKFSKNNTALVDFNTGYNEVLLEFSDNGIGISEEDMLKIDQPFYRGHNARAYTGHGLGLSLTSKIMALHGGSLHIASRLGEYTKVTLRLRLYEDEA